MKFAAAVIILTASIACDSTDAFTISTQRTRIMFTRTQTRGTKQDLHEFDYLLQEVSSGSQDMVTQRAVSFRRIALTDSNDIRTTVLASSLAMPTTEQQIEEEEVKESAEIIQDGDAIESTSDDPYSSALDDTRMGNIQRFQEQKQASTLENKLKSMDLQDIILTLFIPGVIAFVGARWVFNRASEKVSDNKDTILESFTREMLYHDGDFKEMELCIQDYKKKLVWMGPTKTDTMLKKYLESYSKKKTVSPQAIASLSYVFTLFKLSEEKAAKLLVSLCKEMGAEKISSAGKLLFLGSRIMKSPEGKAALIPIKELIMSTYRDGTFAQTLVETSQQAIAEAAYRTAVLAAGKKQNSLTVGWEVLGLTKEVATRIYEEERKEGFLSDRESMYGGQTRKYDKKGRQIDVEGRLVDPSEADDDDDSGDEDASDGAVNNVYECGNCGFTMFVAQGRESKFFGTGFKCPECGAPKSDFKARDSMDD